MIKQEENTITSKLVSILNKMSASWSLEAQQLPFVGVGNRKKPDAFMTKDGHEPVAIEAKYADSHDDVAVQAKLHIGRKLKTQYVDVTDTLHTAMALRYPIRLRSTPEHELEKRLRASQDLEYMLTGQSGGEPYQFPREGFAKGTVADIANALHVGAVPSERIDEAAEELEREINVAAKWLHRAVQERPAIGDSLEAILHQERGKQTARMACLIITDAFVFQDSLAGKEQMESVKSLEQRLQAMSWTAVVEDWEAILTVNYQPIFEDAKRMAEAFAMDGVLVNKLLDKLCAAANTLVQSKLSQIHELAGEVFQRLIVDRKYIKANYTLPTSAALLSALVCPKLPDGRLPKVADFACGTGSLLNGVYRRVQALWEQNGGDASEIHKEMLENNLAGTDIMPNATHMTFATIASAQPSIPLGATRVITAPYGKLDTDTYAVGALELLDAQLLFDEMENEGEQVGGTEHTSIEIKREFPDGEMDIVIQNPPFIRPGAENSSEVPRSVFQSDSHSEADKREMQQALQRKDSRVADGQYGLGSYFIELADRKLRPGGTMGFILTAAVLAGSSAMKLRNMLATEYHDVIVVTIAAARASDCAFSADTNMAECIVVAKKGVGKNTGRGTFVCLKQRPESNLEAEVIANSIHQLKNVQPAENLPSGGDALQVGSQTIGNLLDCPLTLNDTWSASRTKSMALVQVAHHLRRARIWLPLQTKHLNIPICHVEDIAEVGFHSDVIRGKKGPLDIVKTSDTERDGYPCISRANCQQQRAMVIQPDSRGFVRRENRHQLEKVMSVNSRAHYYMLPTFSATSQLAMFTEIPSIGVSAITNVKFVDMRHEVAFMLWCNSTLGWFCHWMHSGKQQAGRGKIKLNSLRTLPTLDVRELTDGQLRAGGELFTVIRERRMKPFNECKNDGWRHVLDARFLLEVFDISEITVHKAMQMLRNMLAAEPSVHAEKQSTCNLSTERTNLAKKGIILPNSDEEDERALATEMAALKKRGILLKEWAAER